MAYRKFQGGAMREQERRPTFRPAPYRHLGERKNLWADYVTGRGVLDNGTTVPPKIGPRRKNPNLTDMLDTAAAVGPHVVETDRRGDETLQHMFAKRRRRQAAQRPAVVGRLGGDEFAVLLWNLSETDARAKAAALEDAIDRLSFVFRGSRVSAGASAGVAIITAHSDVDRVLDEADRAMYVRKAQRRHES